MGRLGRPGLVGRFALGALAVFLVVGLALWLFVSTQLKAKQEQFAQFHAQFVTRSILDHEVGSTDLASPMTGARADELRQAVRSRILVPPVVAVRIWSPEGTILFADNPAMVGLGGAHPAFTQAFAGDTFSVLQTSRDGVNARDPSLPANIFATYMPLRPDGAAAGTAPTWVVEVLQNYSGVQASFAELSRTLALTLAVGLTVLFILLLPVLRQAAHRLSEQTEVLRQNEARLRVLNEDLVEASRVKSEFMANITHELRTPLTGIIGFAELLSSGGEGDLNATQTEDVAQIEKSGGTLLGLIDGILELSRIEAGLVRVSAEPFDVGYMIQTVMKSHEVAARAKGLAVSVDIEPDARRVIGDSDRVRQVLSNLIGNAIKFTERGQIVAQCRTFDLMTEVSVDDTGIGLSEQASKYVFDGFRQADGSVTRRFAGAGLGLAIARRLVEMQGGTMGVESVPGKGSRFWFTLARADEVGAVPVEAPATEESALPLARP